MTRSDEARLRDIIDPAAMATRVADEGEEAFCGDWKNLPVAAKMIAGIGTAASHMSDATLAAFPEAPWGKIRGMRNFVTHEYHNVEPDIVWETLQTSIPELVEALGEEPERRLKTRDSGTGL